MDFVGTGSGLGLCAYGVPWMTGFAGHGTPRANRRALDTPGFLGLAKRLGLAVAELPPGGLPADPAPVAAAELQARSADLGLRLVIAGGRIGDGGISAGLDYAAEAGARVYRCTLSGILCGDRRALGVEGWRGLLREATTALKAAAPKARALGLTIAVENHQDASSDDLVRLCEEAGAPVGINLDTGNPLAVAEDPVIFARRILPFLENVHLKDYRIVRSEAGFRLVHCAIGSGVVDYAALFALFRERPQAALNLEMAALGERHVRLLEDAWWAGYPPRDAAALVPFLRVLHDRQEAGEWRTPWDAGKDAELGPWEMDRLAESVTRMTELLARTGAAAARA